MSAARRLLLLTAYWPPLLNSGTHRWAAMAPLPTNEANHEYAFSELQGLHREAEQLFAMRRGGQAWIRANSPIWMRTW